MKSSFWIAAIGLAAIACAVFGYQYGVTSSKSNGSETDTETDLVQPSSIRGQGKLQPASGMLRIVAQPGERVDELLVDVGDQVTKSQTLAVLGSRRLREKELRLAEIRKEEALSKSAFQKSINSFQYIAAQIAKEEAGEASAKVNNQAQAIAALEANLSTSENALQKLSSMRERPETSDLVSVSEIEKQNALVESLRAQMLQAKGEARLGLESAKRAVRAAENQERLAKFNVDHANDLVPMQTLELAIEVAQLAVDSTELTSPIDGQVLDITIHEGDSVGNRPVMLIGQTEQMVCVAEIPDSQMKLVQLGASVELKSVALERPLKGTVVEVGTMIGPPSMKDPNPYAVVDRKTGKIKIQIQDSDAELASRFVNLQVDVEVSVGSGS